MGVAIAPEIVWRNLKGYVLATCQSVECCSRGGNLQRARAVVEVQRSTKSPFRLELHHPSEKKGD